MENHWYIIQPHLTIILRVEMSVLVTKLAPDFTAAAVMPDNSINPSFNLKSYLNGKIGVLFFYPLDFTFVCPSEILEFNTNLKMFQEEGAELVAVSVDSQFTHLAYKNTKIADGGIGSIQFPMVADLTKQIARDYDVLFNNSVALRGTFLIDQEFKVRHQLVNDLPLGRNIEEALRMVKALKFHQQHGEVCPANWNKGEIGMKPTQDGVADYLASKYQEAK
ncbi:MAG: putative peroxiredoxin [Candidatus Midichloriaceae bacterium]|jgi:peroxiredoxin (alkyl hydroperoxide reductase subunit C)|nr:putative peroxiredoxin [Candidatus Midichloriaceae bacterium]